MTSRPWTLFALAVVPTLVFLSLGEIGARLVYAYHSGDLRCLRAPYGFDGRHPYRTTGTLTDFDECSQRMLTRTVNSARGRGADWPVAKTPGRLRILVTGGSSTFGLHNPDDATWPAFLERTLRERYGRDVEVLNAGRPAQRIEGIRAALAQELPGYRPDVVIYYEGYNNVVNDAVTRLHERHPLVSALYYRSMLYTYVVEKVSLRLGRWEDAYLHERRLFRTELDRLLELLQRHGARPVFVLQATRQAPDARLRTMDLADDARIIAFVRDHAVDAGTLRAYQAQVFIEIVRRVGEGAGITVIDPRAAMAAQWAGRLYCDDIHPTDAGNALLGETVAALLAPSLP